jgi:hypothetical protein
MMSMDDSTFRCYLLSLIEEYGDNLFPFEWRLEHCGVVLVFVWVRKTRRNTRESTRDDNDRIKEEANADAFIFDFTNSQSWKSMTVLFFQMLGM